MADLPSKSALAAALSAAGPAHHEYEQVVLKGVQDELWSGFYAAYALGRLGDFAAASRLAGLLEEVEATRLTGRRRRPRTSSGSCAPDRRAGSHHVTHVGGEGREGIDHVGEARGR